MDKNEERKLAISQLLNHPGWQILDAWLVRQMSGDRLRDLKSWEEYLQMTGEIRGYENLKGEIESILNNLDNL